MNAPLKKTPLEPAKVSGARVSVVVGYVRVFICQSVFQQYHNHEIRRKQNKIKKENSVCFSLCFSVVFLITLVRLVFFRRLQGKRGREREFSIKVSGFVDDTNVFVSVEFSPKRKRDSCTRQSHPISGCVLSRRCE